MNIHSLSWDTKFFDLNIGKLSIDSSESSKRWKEIIDGNPTFDLIYIFDETQSIEKGPHTSDHFEITRLDQKVVYFWKNDNKDFDSCNGIIEYSDEKVSPELRKLGHLSGHESRFLKDQKFPHGSFEKLYDQWIVNSVNKVNCDFVFVQLNEEAKVAGFVTLQLIQEDQLGKIGLIAVDPSMNGKGIGTKLIDKVKSVCAREGLKGFTVATQLENHGACRFYEKNECVLHNQTNIFHAWKMN